MTRWFTTLAQITGVLIQLATVFTPLVSTEYRGYVMGAVAALQAFIGVLAHSFNPDGTPASVAYIPTSGAK